MIKINLGKVELIKSATSFEIRKGDHEQNTISIVSIDNQELRRVSYTKESEIENAIAIGILDLYLYNNVYLSAELINEILINEISPIVNNKVIETKKILNFLQNSDYKNDIKKEVILLTQD